MANLVAGGAKKKPLLDQINAISNLANFVYLRQKGPYGNATPIACAAHLIGNEPFIYTWADDFFVSKPGVTKQLIETYERYGGSVLACKRAEQDDEYDKYGFVSGDAEQTGEVKVARIIEKPGKANAPSELGSVSEYLFTPELFEYLEKASDNFTGHGEFMIQPVVQAMIDDGWGVYAREINNGKFYDTGDKLEYLKTMIDFGLKHETLGPPLAEFLKTRVK